MSIVSLNYCRSRRPHTKAQGRLYDGSRGSIAVVKGTAEFHQPNGGAELPVNAAARVGQSTIKYNRGDLKLFSRRRYLCIERPPRENLICWQIRFSGYLFFLVFC